MYLTFEETSNLIESGKALHIAGPEPLLRKLPKGNWTGGSTEYFMSKDGCKISGEHFSVTKLEYEDFAIKTYTLENIKDVATDAFDNGFSILVLPYDTKIHEEYAKKVTEYKDIFMKNIVGWVSGTNLDAQDQTPIVVNGAESAVYSDKAVAIHLKVPEGKAVKVNIINIFEQNKSAPVITFAEDGFSASKFFVDGKEVLIADYFAENGMDAKLPIIGDYAGHGVNVCLKSEIDGVFYFYAPVFSGIEYRVAKRIDCYEKEFNSKIAAIKETNVVFSCNCVLNFLHGELEGKKIDTFVGPVTFGEIAYQLLNQTLVYVTVKQTKDMGMENL